MNRRDFLGTSGAIAGTAALASSALLAACSDRKSGSAGASGQASAPSNTSSSALSPEQIALLDDVADTMLPTTPASPGAKAAGVGAFANLLLTDCYQPADQEKVRTALSAIDAMCRARAGGPFTKLSPNEREKLMREIDAAAKKEGDTHWFHTIRALSQHAYFSTETGMTKALRYVRVPGRWNGCIPLEKNQPAWG